MIQIASVVIVNLMSLCQVSASSSSTCPVSEGYRYDNTSGLCLRPFEYIGTRNNSKEFCESHGDRLVWLDTAAKHTFFQSIINHTQGGYWLGAYETSLGTWEWSEHVSVCYQKWAAGQPDGSGKCLTIGDWFGYDWDDALCTIPMRAGCERVLETPTAAECPQQMTSSKTVITVSTVISEQLLSNAFEEEMPTNTVASNSSTSGQTVPITIMPSLHNSTPVLSDVTDTSDICMTTSNDTLTDMSIPSYQSSQASLLSTSLHVELTRRSDDLNTVHLTPRSMLISSELKETISTNSFDDVTLTESLTMSSIIPSFTDPTTGSSLALELPLSSILDTVHLSSSWLSPSSEVEGTTTTFHDISVTKSLLTSKGLHSVKGVTLLHTSVLASSSSDTPCRCFCDTNSLSFLDLERKHDELRKRLLLDNRKLSRTVAKYTSVPDGRTSSFTIGSAGVVIMVVFLCLFLVGDVKYVVRLFHNPRKKIIVLQKRQRYVHTNI